MSIFDEIGRISEEVRREIEKAFRSVADRFLYTEDGYRRALTDIEETDEEYILRLEVPGIPKDRIDVRIEGRIVEVKADYPGEEKRRRYILRERGGRGFYRRVEIPSDIASGDAKASYCDGILSINIRKAKPTTRWRIPVE
ncbi:MAG: Hsp20/alpha crystallin family protein [Candidatus Bathyarchaeota archaeon]|nr:Hsp20/alpha crystallin family protein [Candidatus Bathyarchaeota archaeon]